MLSTFLIKSANENSYIRKLHFEKIYFLIWTLELAYTNPVPIQQTHNQGPGTSKHDMPCLDNLTFLEPPILFVIIYIKKIRN